MDIYNLDEIEGTTEFGGTVKVVVNEETPSNLMSGTFTLKPGEALVPDIHESDEVFYIVSGVLTLRDDQCMESHQVPAGRIVRIPRKQVHLSSNEGNQDVVIFFTFANG
jgi:quercetin dioxygenase-like cupin family protein